MTSEHQQITGIKLPIGRYLILQVFTLIMLPVTHEGPSCISELTCLMIMVMTMTMTMSINY